MFVKNHMTPNPINIPSDTPVFEALTILKRQKIRQLPVVDDGRLVGLVTERDLLTVSPSPATSLSIHEINYLLSKMTVREVMIK
ncbi:MAG: CBS domain-containing protein, partial [bacterium]